MAITICLDQDINTSKFDCLIALPFKCDFKGKGELGKLRFSFDFSTEKYFKLMNEYYNNERQFRYVITWSLEVKYFNSFYLFFGK